MKTSDLTRYPVNGWRLSEMAPNLESAPLSAALFALGNGYIGIRGSFEEENEVGCDGNYLNGVFLSDPITYGEKAYGYPRRNQRIAPVPSAKSIRLYIEGECFSLQEGAVLDYERSLDFREGFLQRRLTWRSPMGKTVAINIRRLVSLQEKNLCLIHYQVTPLDFSGEIRLVSAIDSRLPDAGRAQTESDDPRVGCERSRHDMSILQCRSEGSQLALVQRIDSSGFNIVTAAEHRLEAGCDFDRDNIGTREQVAEVIYTFRAHRGEAVRLTKYIAYFSSQTEAGDSLLHTARRYLAAKSSLPFDHYGEGQKKNLAAFWEAGDIEIRGDSHLQQGIRFNLFHLYQSLGRDGKTNIAAKGLSGAGYDGHYFWDTEIYVLPFFLYTQPRLARKLLEYRYRILDAARQRARELSMAKGALFPWRTIGGEECSAYYPAGTAQFHINADIAYAVKRYYEATGDREFMLRYGAEIVLESARCWMQLGYFDARENQRFTINTVTGPDEYTALVNNNFFTNAMARAHLQFAVEIYRWLAAEAPRRCRELGEKIELDRAEPEGWERAARKMFLPYDESLGIHPQDDGFLQKQVWDFQNTPAAKYPLLLHYHPLVIYRHQVCKQADVLLALFLLGQDFSVEQKKRDFDYYEAITTHDSTLSACIHSIIASEIGYRDKALAYFHEVVRMDLDNRHHNTQHGLHTACMGGAWMCIVNGFAGLRIENGQLHFNPYVPEGLGGYRFKVCLGGSRVQVDVEPRRVSYTLVEGASIGLIHAGKNVQLTALGKASVFELT